MPHYDYEYTDKEGGTFELFQRMSDSAKTSHDGRPCRKLVSAPKLQLSYDADPIILRSVGMKQPEQINAFRQACPGVEISSNPKDKLYGFPVVKSRSEKKKVLKALNCHEAS